MFLSCFDENAKNYRGLLIRQLDNAQINIVFGQNVGVTVPGEFDREMHIAIVKDGASYRIYADGLLVAEAESPADSYDGTLLIGAQRDAGRQYLPHQPDAGEPPVPLCRCDDGSGHCGI